MTIVKTKIRTLFIRPIKSADLAFSSAGLLSYQSSSARLGGAVKAFHKETLHQDSSKNENCLEIDEEIKNDNRAVGLISMIISIGLSYIIGAGIS